MLWLKQLFCRHKWQTLDSYRYTEYIDGVKNECLSEIQECEKCGKRKCAFIHAPLVSDNTLFRRFRAIN